MVFPKAFQAEHISDGKMGIDAGRKIVQDLAFRKGRNGNSVGKKSCNSTILSPKTT